MYVKVFISKNQAEEKLAKKVRPLSKKRHIIKAELLYLPCYVFSIEVESSKKGKPSEQVCIDGILGQFAFFKEAEITSAPFEQARHYDFEISQAEAEKIALAEYKTQLLKLSLKKKVNVVVSAIRFERKIYYPFWIGYFRRRDALDFDVIDGQNAERQGATMRPVFIKLLLQKKLL